MFLGWSLYPWIFLQENKLGMLCLLLWKERDLTSQTVNTGQVQLANLWNSTTYFKDKFTMVVNEVGSGQEGRPGGSPEPYLITNTVMAGSTTDVPNRLWKSGSTSPSLQLPKASNHTATNPRPNTSSNIGLHLSKSIEQVFSKFVTNYIEIMIEYEFGCYIFALPVKRTSRKVVNMRFPSWTNPHLQTAYNGVLP